MSFYGVLKINVSAACPPKFLLFFFCRVLCIRRALSFFRLSPLSFQPHPGFHQYLWVQVPFKRNPFICCILGPFVVCMVGYVAMVPAMLELGLKLSAMQSLHRSLAPFMRQKKLCPKSNGNKKMDCDLHDYVQYFHWDFYAERGWWGDGDLEFWMERSWNLYVKDMRWEFWLFARIVLYYAYREFWFLYQMKEMI